MIRLQKLLAAAGLGSRRTVEDWIRAGRITIAGRTAQLGDRAAAGDDVRLDGRKLELDRTAGQAELLLYYKPLGEVTTRHDPQGRPTVFERLPKPAAGRWITVGRLDVNTAGLLLFTTDGELAHHLMHPSSEVEREYLVRIRGRPGPEILTRLLAGVPLEDGPARFDRITADPQSDAGPGSHASYRVVLHEGRNREVRRLWSAVGFEVSRLLRIRYGPLVLPRDLRPGMSRKAAPAERQALRRAAGGDSPQPSARPATGTADADARKGPKPRPRRPSA
jgi:23S rRNA pseudouridine2605 synthase